MCRPKNDSFLGAQNQTPLEHPYTNLRYELRYSVYSGTPKIMQTPWDLKKLSLIDFRSEIIVLDETKCQDRCPDFRESIEVTLYYYSMTFKSQGTRLYPTLKLRGMASSSTLPVGGIQVLLPHYFIIGIVWAGLDKRLWARPPPP